MLGIASRLLGNIAGIKAAILAYDTTAVVYVVSSAIVMFQSTSGQMKKRALAQDEGKTLVLAIVILALVFSVCAIFANLSDQDHLQNSTQHDRLFLTLFTVVSSWFFTNLVFSLHYAHDYYFDLQKSNHGGLVFLPEDKEPSYIDFIYFSFTIGATAQTSDVALNSTKMRKTCLLHSILAFFFNATLMALAVSMASGFL